MVAVRRLSLVLALALVALPILTASAAPTPLTAPPPLAPLAAPPASDAAAREAVRLLPRATAVNDADGNKVFDDLERAFLAAPAIDVLVSFVARADATRLTPALERAHGFEAHRTFTIVPAFAARLTLPQVLALAARDDVRQLEWSRPGVAELDTATVFTGARAVQLNLSITGDGDGDPSTFSTKDNTIAILDTGFSQHRDLVGKVLAFVDLGDENHDEHYDGATHGTHVAGIAVGTGAASNGTFAGVAPGASMVGLKITGAKNPDTQANAIAAYEWVVKNRDVYGIRIATMSFGFGTTKDGTSALERAVDAAWDAGIVTFKSNGNSGPDPSTTTIPGGARGIISVGNMLDPSRSPLRLTLPGGVVSQEFGAMYGFSLTASSSRGPTADGRVKPDLAAPGTRINAADAEKDNGYTEKTGTSMAAPFAAGTAALVLAANPALEPDAVREILTATAEDWGAPGPDNEYGAGRIDVLKAVRLAAERADRPTPEVETPPVPAHVTKAGSWTTPVATGTFPVKNATGKPLGATLIATGGVILQLEILDPSGEPLAHISGPFGLGTRHATVGFLPERDGEYGFRAVGTPTATWTLDVSEGQVPSTILGAIGEGLEEILPANKSIPAPAPALALAILAGLALAMGRRRIA